MFNRNCLFSGYILLCSVTVLAQNSPLPTDSSTSDQVNATGIMGTWHCQFETPFGLQTYQLHVAKDDDGMVTVLAEVESGGEERRISFIDVEVEGEFLSFAEMRQMGGREFRIDYKGTLNEMELSLSRSFGQRATQAVVATREPTKSTPATDPAPVVTVKIEQVMKDAFKDWFLIGLAGDIPTRYSEVELQLAAEHFSAITPENCMKPESVQPAENRWQFDRPDALVQWAKQNEMTVHGHTLVWHAQTPNWFFEGNDSAVIKQRMKNHIQTLVGRYKGQLQSWDVVNEAINDGGNSESSTTENLRDSKWLQALGPEYLTLAFKFARQAAPEATLYYNDYNIESGSKHASSMVLLRRLLDEGAPIDGVGIQGHWRSGQVPFDAIDKAITDYASLGLKVSVTELDITIRGESGGQFGSRRFGSTASPSAEDLLKQAEDYAKLFEIFGKHKNVIERVTFWGLNDRRSWRRGQHPLLFDANNNPKPAYAKILSSIPESD